MLSIFCSQARRGEVLNVYEDGEIIRDFVFVDDVVAAFMAALQAEGAANGLFNVGTGVATSMLGAAREVLHSLGLDGTRLRISGDFRPGDIRHAVADVTRIGAALGWRAQVPFEEGLRRLAEWSRDQR